MASPHTTGGVPPIWTAGVADSIWEIKLADRNETSDRRTHGDMPKETSWP